VIYIYHEIQPKLMVNLYNVGASIVHKYIGIVYDNLANKDKLYIIYIHRPIRQCLISIIKRFRDLISIQQIVGVIDITHVPLLFRPYKRTYNCPMRFL
jgi:hypothetical protein